MAMTTATNVVMEEVDEAFEAFVHALSELAVDDRIGLAAHYRSRIDRVRLAALVEVSGGDEKVARSAAVRADGEATSYRSRRVDAGRAAALAMNPGLAAAVEMGAVSVEAIDALNRAADEATGLIPDDLVGEVVGVGADQARRIVRRYMADRAIPDDVNDLHDRQHEHRRVRPYNTTASDGTPLAGLAFEGPKAILDEWHALLSAEADTAYEAAGGRETPGERHVSFGARLFDAAGQYFAGGGTGRRGRAEVVITVPVDTGSPARSAAGEPVPESVVRRWLADARLGLAFTDLNGVPLWMGRARRHATVAQRVALIIRDRGCVLCGAAPSRCQAHHIMPWEAPGRGATNLGNLVLLCGTCHRDLHRRNHTIEATCRSSGAQVWSTRPALPHEVPPEPHARGSDPP